MNHSEAPWSIDADGDLQDAQGNKIVDMNITRGGNIPVLVAAPEMLKALKGLQMGAGCFDHCYEIGLQMHSPACQAVRAVIIKAEGRTS